MYAVLCRGTCQEKNTMAALYKIFFFLALGNSQGVDRTMKSLDQNIWNEWKEAIGICYLWEASDLSKKTSKTFPNNMHEQVFAVCRNKPSIITHTYTHTHNTERKFKGISIKDIHLKSKFLSLWKKGRTKLGGTSECPDHIDILSLSQPNK